MRRYRFLYEKRGRLCFVPHVEMPPLLCRTFRRAGCTIACTESFVPKDKISLGPPLPMGVAGLAEPGEIWLERDGPPELKRLEALSHKGLRIYALCSIEGGPALSKVCRDGLYRLYPEDGSVCKRMALLFEKGWRPAPTVGWIKLEESFVDLVIKDANQVGPGAVVSSMKAEGLISGWEDIFVVRTAVGIWNGARMAPALEAGDGS